jgi:hypothetical protein
MKLLSKVQDLIRFSPPTLPARVWICIVRRIS